MLNELILRKAFFNHPDFLHLIEELDKEFWVRYPQTQQNFEPFNKVDETFRIILAYQNELPIGCGCFRSKYEDTIEIKRMYVRPDHRNQGIAKKLLTELESIAISEGFRRSILETGNRQPEAIRAYQTSGYHVIPNFPPYENVMESICMEKILKPTV